MNELSISFGASWGSGGERVVEDQIVGLILNHLSK